MTASLAETGRQAFSSASVKLAAEITPVESLQTHERGSVRGRGPPRQPRGPNTDRTQQQGWCRPGSHGPCALAVSGWAQGSLGASRSLWGAECTAVCTVVCTAVCIAVCIAVEARTDRTPQRAPRSLCGGPPSSASGWPSSACPCAAPRGAKFGPPVSGWQQQLVSRNWRFGPRTGPGFRGGSTRSSCRSRPAAGR